MSHRQAFHTSCRSGLSGISGFQINAASAGLDGQQLAALAGAHARYTAPHDLPYEPTPEQIGRFPVALKASVVPGVGPVVSRTAYVGREYRGVNGTPDEGRFGNYFCHMVVGEPGDDPFDGLTAVELWDATHWTTDEAADPTLADLGPLAPGPLEVTDVISAVVAAPPGVAAALVDRALRALDGNAPLLIIDPVAERAVTWLAWITFALPPDAAQTLTFSTFEGRPGDAANLHVIATTPACDTGGLAGTRFERIDVSAPVDAGAEPILYARVAAALAERDPEALITAARRVSGDSPPARGASLAITGRLTELARPGELPGLLAELQRLVSAGMVEEAAIGAGELPPDDAGDKQVVGEWATLHALSRASGAGDAARKLASVALIRMVAHADALPEDLAPVPTNAPTAPTVAGIGAWIRATEAAQGSERSGRFVLLGVHLGLLGLNVPVDNRAAAVLAQDLQHETTARALSSIAAAGSLGHVIARVAEIVADEPPTSRGARARLLALCRFPEARDAIHARAQRLQTFDAHAAWQRARVESGLATPAEAARELAPIAVDEGARAEVRELWGPTGPRTADDLHQLIRAYIDTSSPVPASDADRAFRTLMTSPLPVKSPSPDSLGYTLARLPEDQRRRADFWAWVSTFYVPGVQQTTLAGWGEGAYIAFLDRHRRVPDERWEELVRSIAATLIRERRQAGFAAVLERFSEGDFETLCTELGLALARELESASDPTAFAAAEFEDWWQLRLTDRRKIVDVLLEVAFERLSARDVEQVGERLDPRWIELWNVWAQAHPRTGARAKVARAFKRLGKDRPEVGA